MGVLRPDLIMKGVVPIIMAGIIGIYGLVVSVLIGNGCKFLLCLCIVLWANRGFTVLHVLYSHSS